MAKKPVAGKVKTRLTPPLSPGEAARLYRCLLEDSLDLAAGAAGPAGARAGVAFAPPSAEGYFRRLAPSGFMLVPQPPGNLGARLDMLFRTIFRRGFAAVCLLNSDGPDLPGSAIGEAFDLLGRRTADVVLGPNPDGGFYLVGLRAPADIFRAVPWSTPAVLAETIGRAARAGLACRLLRPWPDLDTAADLRAALARWDEGKAPPPRTYGFLGRLRAVSGVP